MRPAPLLLVLLAGWAALGVACVLGYAPLQAWSLCGGAIALLAAVDAVLVARLPSPELRRDCPDTLALNVEREVRLHLQGGPRQTVEVFDLTPGGWPVTGLPRRVRLRADHDASVSYRTTPTTRGAFTFEGVHVRLRSPLWLWRQQRRCAPAQRVKVYPNFAPLTRFALFSAEQASRLVGAHIKRRRGEGTDFHQMREYRVGDSLRQIDWKATSRARRLISREYQDEKNQQLIMLVDTGRRLLAQEDGLSHFDHVLNASLVVSYLALRQGDSVGLLATGAQERWLAPQRGMGGVDALLHACYDLQAEPVATDYLAAATTLAMRQRRRSLVMLVTNVRDEDIEELMAAIRLLQRQHLVCVASLRERDLDDGLSTPVESLDDALQAGAIARYLQQRAAAHDALRAQRVMVLDVTAAELPGALVERYLTVKRDGLL